MARSSPVNLERSLPRAAYWDARFFEREKRAVFWDQWFYAGRAELLDGPGSYRVLEIAGESIILVRGDDGRIYGHINLCRHRGSQLLCGEGTLRGAIRCPYHAWAYAHDGRLIASPFIESSSIPEDAKHLYAAAVAEWAGFLFVRVNAAPDEDSVASLHAQLNGVPERLRRYPLRELRVARTIRYDVNANWKVLLENYNECYHCAGVHPELCKIVPAFKQHGGAGLDWDRGIPHKDGAFTFTTSGTSARALFDGLNEEERTRHKGELIYPNMLLSLSAEHVAVFSLWPQASDRTIVICDFLFHPDEMQKADFDPSDAVEFWDLVNRQDWKICESVQRGMRSQKFRYGYYAPMEDWSLDMRRYICEHLGPDAAETED